MDKLFDIIADSKSRREIYEGVLKLVEDEKRKATGTKMAEVYALITRLQNSENNAGWEERHSERIREMNDASMGICEEYEEFLP